MPFRNLSPTEIQAMREHNEPFRLIDVREPDEYTIAHVEGAELMPLSQNQEWIGTLPHDETLVIMCHHGGRSAQVAHFLSERMGHTNIVNMDGGIEAWSHQVDPTIPRY